MERVENLPRNGFQTVTLGAHRIRVRRGQCAALVEELPGGLPRIERLGVVLGDEIAELIDGGYQKFLETPSGTRRPALASQLKALHDFQEDLREGLGVESLYNESLGTVFDRHAYDRLAGRL